MTFKRCIFLTVALGGVGLFFRLAVWTAAYDNEAQLVTNPGLVTIFNVFFVLCCLLAVLYFASRWRRNAVAPAPYASSRPLTRLLRLGAALCSLAAGALMLAQQFSSGQLALVLLIAGGLLVIQSVILFLLTQRKEQGSSFYGTLLLFPPFVSCCWLVAFYHQIGGVPNREIYLWSVAAGILSAVCWVGYTGFFYEKQTGRRFGITAILLMLATPVALAAPLTMPWRFSLLGQWLWMWAALLELKPASPSEPQQQPEQAPLTEPKSTLSY